MNYEIIRIEESKNEDDQKTHKQFINIFEYFNSEVFYKNSFTLILMIFLLLNIPNYFCSNVNVLSVVTSPLIAIPSGMVITIVSTFLDHYLLRKKYWKSLEYICANIEFPNDISFRMHKKIASDLCQKMNINKLELTEKLNMYKKFYQFLELKYRLIYIYKKTHNILNYYDINAIIKFNIYINEELLTINNMDSIDINQIMLMCENVQNRKATNNGNIDNPTPYLSDIDYKKQSHVTQLINLLNAKKTILEQQRTSDIEVVKRK